MGLWALECMLWSLECMLRALERMLQTLECMLGTRMLWTLACFKTLRCPLDNANLPTIVPYPKPGEWQPSDSTNFAIS